MIYPGDIYPIGQQLKYRTAGTRHPCYLCLREVKPGKEGTWVHVGEGGAVILARGERSPNGQNEDGAGGMGWFPVGSDCVKHVPAEYRFKIGGAT